MAILTASEFEAVISRVLIKLDKELYQRHESPDLEGARRTLSALNDAARDPAKLKTMRDALGDAGNTIRSEIPRDGELGEFLWDLGDYIDFRC